MAKILEKRRLTPITQLYKVDAPLVAKAARPGQFVIIRVREGGERIPLTIADYDREAGVLTIVVQEVGTTTRYMGQLGVGDEILDLLCAGAGERYEHIGEGHIDLRLFLARCDDDGEQAEQHRGEHSGSCATGHTENVGIGERVPKQGLEETARYRKQRTSNKRGKNARCA